MVRGGCGPAYALYLATCIDSHPGVATMPSEVPDSVGDTSPTHRQDHPSRTNKRQRQLSQTLPSPGQQPDDISGIRGRQTLIQPQGARDFSRDAAEMHCSSTPPEAAQPGTIKYTRTGRVSKATKGQRVHHCEECGKVSVAVVD